MVLSSAIVCDHDRRIAGDRRSVFPYDRRRLQNFLRSAICDRLRSYGNQPLIYLPKPCILKCVNEHSGVELISRQLPFKKSNFMVLRPRQRRQTLDLFIQIDNNTIDCVKEMVFLGVILDEHLSWKPHILSVSRKISKSIGIIYKSSFCLHKTSCHCLYYSLVYPYLI